MLFNPTNFFLFLKSQEDISNQDMDGNKTRTSQPSSGMGNETTSNQPIVLGAGGESTRLVSGNENNF